jgi:hypothetical protein
MGKATRAMVGAAVAMVTIGALTGCMAIHLPEQRKDGQTFSEWQNRMGEVLRAEDAGGAGGGDTRGTLSISAVPAGSYDVLIACTGVPFVRMRISDVGHGTLTRSDIPCGATVRLPIDYVGGKHSSDTSDGDIEFDATHTPGGVGWWAAAVDPVGWEPSGTYSFG